MKNIIDKLYSDKDLSDGELKLLINSDSSDYLFKKSLERKKEFYGLSIYTRGLIEFSNHCKNNCFYCGLRAENTTLCRYRLTKEDILKCCEQGYRLGFRTFVLQSGEDLHYSNDYICEIVYSIKNQHPDCAVTLSIGEKSYESYKAYKNAGADRYLLRHETADETHYSRLHPENMSLKVRKECLFNLKELGFQVGSGFMVGSPYQTDDSLVADLRFLQEIQPDMIGIGPFLPHHDTPFHDMAKGSLTQCLNLIAILRLMFPYALIPATTALGTLYPQGREKGLMAGANVLMPNLSPTGVRELYSLYNDKIHTNEEAAENIGELRRKIISLGFEPLTDIGDVKPH